MAGKFILYHYAPSMAAAVVFVILFSLTTGLHIYQMLRTRTWFFIAFCIGGLFEISGYIARIASANQTSPDFTLGPYIVQSVMLLVAPALYAASIYMELGRIVELVRGDHLLPVKRQWITKLFVGGDVLCFLLQSSGGGLMANHDSHIQKIGSDVIVGGLFIQIIFFGCFVITSVIFHRRLLRSPTPESQSVTYKRHLLALYVGSIFIFVRSIVRVVEFIQGFNGYIIGHEAFIYVFDATPMFLVMAIFNWIHPSEIRSQLKGGKAIRGIQMVSL